MAHETNFNWSFLPFVAVGTLVAGFVAFLGGQYYLETRPDPIEFDALTVEDRSVMAGESIHVLARVTYRVDMDVCINGIQAHLKNRAETIRLQAPTRTMTQNGVSSYELQIPPNVDDGLYYVRLLETVNCNGNYAFAATPWLELRVIE